MKTTLPIEEENEKAAKLDCITDTKKIFMNKIAG